MSASEPRFDAERRSRRRGAMLAVAVYGASLGIARLAGFRMSIPWHFYQILDGPTLRAHPLESLCLLHSEPPGLNVLLALVLRTADALGATPEDVAAVCFAALGLVAAIALVSVARVLTGSGVVAMLALVALLADPGFHVYAHLFFHEFLDQVLVLVLLAATTWYVLQGRRAGIVAVAGIAALLALTRLLFHPVWAVGYCALVVMLRGCLAPAERRRCAHGVLAALVLLPALLAWPVKNLLVFGRFTMASMTAYSLAHDLPGCRSDVVVTPAGVGVDSAVLSDLGARAIARCGAQADAILTSPTKSDGSTNWNHVAVLAAAPELARCGAAWRRDHPVAWLARAAGQYAMWTNPTFVNTYDGTWNGPTDAGWIAYATGYQRTLFRDLRPAVERLMPNLFLHRQATVGRRPVPYTVFGVVLLPAILVLAAWQQVARPRSPRTAVAASALLVLLVPMLAACLSDGREGNRMRLSTTPALLVVELALVGELLARRPRA